MSFVNTYIKNSKSSNLLSLLILSFICCGLIIAKFKALSLPYFWDEAWPYVAGVHWMHGHGLSLLPGAIPFELSRGHPLLFHFLGALWMKIFGTSLVAVHIFPLLISCLLILMTYFFGKKFFSETAGIFSALILSVQPVFLSQSSMLLPEILLALLSLTTIYFYLSGRKLLFVLTAIAMLLVKETGVVTIAALFLFELLFRLPEEEKPSHENKLNRFFLILIPVLMVVPFFILQKINTGYFFFPDYTSGKNFLWSNITDEFIKFSAFHFIYQGRNSLSLVLIISLAFIFISRKNVVWKKRELRITYLFCLFIIQFLFFSACNFYSPRYTLDVLSPFVLVVTYFFITAFSKTKWIIALGLVSVLSTAIFFCFQKKPVNDHNLNYADAICVTQEAVRFCENENLYSKTIQTNFLMSIYLSNPYCGFLSSSKTFSNLSPDFSERVEYTIIEGVEMHDILSVRTDAHFTLVKRFEKNAAWCEIYKKL